MNNNQIYLSGIWNWLLYGKTQNVLLFHFLLLVITILNKWFYALWIIILLFGYFFNQVKAQLFLTPFLLAYILSAEIFSRALNLSPIIPYEFCKYFMFFLLFYLIIKSKLKGTFYYYGLFILVLCIPAFFLTIFSQSDSIFKETIFNGFGILNLALAIIFFSQYKINIYNFNVLMRLIVTAALPFLGWFFYKTPDFDSLEFSLSSSSAGIGGFGSNQVSTLFSFIFSVCVFQLINKIYVFKNSLLSVSIAMLCLFSALISFSRGGIIVTFVALFLVMIIARKKINKRFFINALLFLPVLFVVLFYTNNLTNNYLLLRYQGQTNAMQSGKGDMTLDSFTTGRFNILKNDLSIWNDNFFFGTGIGQSPKLRKNYGEKFIISHVELSRLLAEHGVFGLFIVIIIIILFIRTIRIKKNTLNKSFAIFCLTISVLTTFHAAMRTGLSPMLFGFAMMQIINKSNIKTPMNIKYEKSKNIIYR